MNMVPEFILRKQGRTKIAYEVPELEAILKETYGVIVLPGAGHADCQCDR